MNAVRHALHSARLAPLALDVRLSSSVHQAPRSLRFEQWRVSSVARMPRLPPAPRCRHFRPPSAGGRGLVTVVERDVHGAGQAGVRRNAKRWWARCFGKARRSALVSPRIASILGNGSFVLVALSFLSTDILTLRVLNVAAGGLMFAFNVTAMERPMLISMRWGALLGLINLVQIFKLLRERRVDILPPREKEAYSQFFETGCLLSETQFYRLSSIGEWQRLHKGANVTIQGVPNEYVYLILSGVVEVNRKVDFNNTRQNEVCVSGASTTLGRLEKGSWIGERGYLRQFALPAYQPRDNLTAPSFATVSVAGDEAKLLRWHRADLQHAMQKDPAINAGVLLSMTRDVVRKLRVQSEQRSGKELVDLAAAGVYGEAAEMEVDSSRTDWWGVAERAMSSLGALGGSILGVYRKGAGWVSSTEVPGEARRQEMPGSPSLISDSGDVKHKTG